MSSPILRVVSKFLLPALLLLSLWGLFRGHDHPGGGFIGGLTVAAGFALRTFACGAEVVRAELRVSPRTLIGTGLLTSLLSGLIPWGKGGPFLEAHWLRDLPLFGKLGTPLLFDVGIYILVLGTVLASMFALSEVEP